LIRDEMRIEQQRPIKEIGLRPGEKLFEELITEGQGIQETEHDEIMVLKSETGTVGEEELTLKKMRKHIKRLVRLAEACDGDGIREELKRIVPEYTPNGL